MVTIHDDSLAKALARRKDLLAQLAKVEEFLRLHSELFGTEGEQVEPPLSTEFRVDDPTQEDLLALKAATVARKRQRTRPIAKAAGRLIREAGHPLTRSEIVEGLEKLGINLPTADKPRYVGTILWRHDDWFVNLPGAGYWLKTEAYEPLNYQPGDKVDEGGVHLDLEALAAPV